MIRFAPMADNPSKQLKDRKLVSQQPYEVAYFAKKHNLTMGQARTIIQQHGPSRRKCDAAAKAFLLSI
jgi:hypothetical protein